MRVADWGQIDGPLIVFGGVHSNRQALDAMLAVSGAKVCTGDIAAYCADPVICLDRIRATGVPSIAGNCESQLAEGARDCGCGFAQGTSCDLMSARWYAHANGAIDVAQRQWMGALPDWAVLTHAGRRWLVVHGAPSAQNKFLWSTTPDTELAEEIALAEAIVGRIDGILSGHSGIPFIREISNHIWVNAGAIGMPAHDGRAATCFARIDGADIGIERLPYDHTAAHAAMVAAGLVQGYHDTLRSGWWPSVEVLPQPLRNQSRIA